ncbi:undecaprenyldiphospho-muramoylpentapeptide beta-N-acetylglucosaminyltransferase [Melghirimyces profundicolus]|nr:undecaprenyldiphospho-muramoylpentapeptide beta-N-acetylglucosaminyltransferase [Melghirimyces profundicolus]
MRKKIIFTGGGSAGHVTVNQALIPRFLKDGWDVGYIGSHDGIERQLIQPFGKVKYYGISTGKLRRYFDWNNFNDPFRVLKGIGEAYRILRKEKPDVVFSKGGFVSVPVVIGGWMNGVPVVIHESDLTPGLANRLAIPFATRVCTTFPETTQHLKAEKGVYVGALVREELKRGKADEGRRICGFTADTPVLLIMGGSLGSRNINRMVHRTLPSLLQNFQIAHICGKGNVDPSMERPGYRQFEYLTKELPHMLAMADGVISRAGSNAIFELLALKKPMLLIPLSKSASRGDQVLNARSFKRKGYAEVLEEEELNEKRFLRHLSSLFENKEAYIAKMAEGDGRNTLHTLRRLIEEAACREGQTKNLP